MTIGKILRQARIDRCMTQTQLGKELQITPQSICYFERDKKTPGMDTLRKYSDYFGLDPKELAKMKYGEKENQDRNQ